MLDKSEVFLGSDYFKAKNELDNIAQKVIFTGCIDEFFDYQFGHLEYRSLSFENKIIEMDDFQGNAVVNYTEKIIPYTRIIEHKHFDFGKQPNTVITYEYPDTYSSGKVPYYPINNDSNTNLYRKYKDLADHFPSIIFGGRLGFYKYLDMDEVIEAALLLAFKELEH